MIDSTGQVLGSVRDARSQSAGRDRLRSPNVEIHQALSVLIAVAPAFELALQDIFLPRTRGPDAPALPAQGGTLATTLVAAFELRHLHVRTACACAG
ncbi:hypothetical protein ACFQ7J_05810 [Streptomyces sp. NPDC056501]|uniref:hypothetical protein n=1 Tax=Streptomyces sp. NPDC056501 TaxID=3345841 RepID=UPI003680FA3E